MLLAYVCRLHTFRTLESLRAWLLDEALPRLVPSDWLSYNEVDLSHPDNTQSILRPESNVFQKLPPLSRTSSSAPVGYAADAIDDLSRP